MNKNELNNVINKDTAYTEATHWNGMDLNIKFDEKRCYPKGKDAKIIGADYDNHLDLQLHVGEATDEIALDHEGFLQCVKGGVQVALACIKEQPGIIRDLLHFAFEAIKLAFDCKREDREIRKIEAQARLQESMNEHDRIHRNDQKKAPKATATTK